MQDIKPPKPIEEMSDDEARAYVEGSLAVLESQRDGVKARFAQNIKRAQDRLKYAEGELARVEAAQKQIEPYKDDPEGAFHYTNMELLRRVFASTKRMMEIQVAANQQNLAALEAANLMEGEVKFIFPEDNLEFQEHQARVDVCMGLFNWADAIEGIDGILRAALNEKAIDVQNEEEEAARAAYADEIKAAMKEDRNLAMLVGTLGTELQDTEALFDWAKATLRSLRDLPNEAKRPLLADSDWQKLNGKVLALAELGKKVQPYPVLARTIKASDVGQLPYEGIPAGELGGGTGKLGSARLGANRPAASGRLGQ